MSQFVFGLQCAAGVRLGFERAQKLFHFADAGSGLFFGRFGHEFAWQFAFESLQRGNGVGQGVRPAMPAGDRKNPGHANHSYGIHVAQLAGLPDTVIQRAKAVLAQLESTTSPRPILETQQALQFDATLPAPHPMLEEVRQMDLFSMTPLDALNRLAALQQRLLSE